MRYVTDERALMDGFSIARLSEQARAFLDALPDERTQRLKHEVAVAEMRSFWRSLTGDQALFVATMLRRIMNDDDPVAKAGAYFGNAEMILHVMHNLCLAGDEHRDPDELLQELTLRGNEFEALQQGCELYHLRQMTTHGITGEHESAYVCTGCGHVYASLEQRKDLGGPDECPGCLDIKEND